MNRKQLCERAAQFGLIVTTYAPGDGVTRYRFARGPGSDDYFGARAVHTALGLGDAAKWLDAYAAGFGDGRNT